MARNGFSLLELLIATAILAIVAVMLLRAHSMAVLTERKSRELDEVSLAARSAAADWALGLLGSGNSTTNYGECRVILDPEPEGNEDLSVLNGWRQMDVSVNANSNSPRTIYLLSSEPPPPAPGPAH